MMDTCRLKEFFAIILLLVPVSLHSQQPNYREIFGDDWKKAEAFVDDNRIWIQPLLEENNISFPLAIAVIFPELVRYSALSDKMETSMLKILYINLGEEYANFSIGHFQMKPSFAETIREKAPEILNRTSDISFKRQEAFEDIRQYRKSIVSDLEDAKIQLNYLIAFYKICNNEYDLAEKEEVQRVKFLATVYNFGIGKSDAQIEEMIERKFFNTKLFSSEKYSYADVALYWYKWYTTLKKVCGQSP
jgi:hypothetical protein